MKIYLIVKLGYKQKNKLQNRYNEVVKIGIKLAEDINYMVQKK